MQKNLSINPKHQFNILQITDTHLFEHDQNELFGINSNVRFYQTIAHINQNEVIRPNIVIMTGDASQDRTAGSYLKLAKYMDRLNLPIYWITGNHDDPDIMGSVLSEFSHFKRLRRLETGNWDFVFVDTCQQDANKGYISSQEITALEAELSQSIEQHKAIALVMHHHPAPVDTPLVDEFILQNNKIIFDLIKNQAAIKLIICGHVHGDYSLQSCNIPIESSPATCFQWEKGTNSLKIEPRSGYKLYQFHQSGFSTITRWISHHEPIQVII